MKVQIKLDSSDVMDVEWPEGVPLPMAGDHVLMKTPGGPVGVIVDRRFFGIGKDGAGQPLAEVRIQGHAAPEPK
ncbi:hypothetical protein [Marinobacter shengliensis]